MNKKLYKLMDWARIEAVVYSEEDDPLGILGPKEVSGGTLLQTFLPHGKEVSVKLQDGREFPMVLADDEGFFTAFIKERKLKYTYMVTDDEGVQAEMEDAYRFAPLITEKDTKKFNAGIHYTAYQILGAHVKTRDGVAGVEFAVWAPNAVRVSVVGDFNRWDGRVHQMQRLWDSGIFELFVPGVKEGDIYKYEIKVKGGMLVLKSDPYGFGAELRPDTASVVRDLETYEWKDTAWLGKRKKLDTSGIPMSIYELHLGSWKKPEDGREFYNYRELAEPLADYVTDMGYTHVELMPVMEHPLDASWGYQVIGYYAPTSRYGTPEDFMYFMDVMHRRGIGVILDWVPAHFPRDTHGLSNFDGTCLYEHKDPRQGFHPHWGTLIYNYGRPEVRNYLIANALFWVEKYHADGIRMDAVASMLYLDYGKQDGQWVANIYGGNENLEAVDFLKHLNSVLKKYEPGVLIIAEESTAWPKITGSVEEDGLGFDYKWNMGWMNDFLGFMRFDPYFRSHHYGELTFSMIYAYSEQFILVFSHDEVVHGKASMVAKMPGGRDSQLSNLRAAYGYMMAHPGKKLIFMGQDIAEFDEWNEERSVQWDLLQYDDHKNLQHYVRSLHKLYRAHPALYSLDNSIDGFEWINNISANETIVVFLRKSREPDETLLVICNFADATRENYKVGVPGPGKYKEIFNSDSEEFGGKGFVNPRLKQSKKDECDEREYSIRIKVPALGISVFSCEKAEEPLADNSRARAKRAAGRSQRSGGSLKEQLAKKVAEEA